jgi:predicted nucleic acid-binding protein
LTPIYLDSSVALHAILSGPDAPAARWLADAWSSGAEVLSSRLLRLEVVRVLRREDLDLDVARPLLDRVSLISLDDEIVRIAEAIEPHEKSLDALHLATCLLLAPDVLVATHDRGLRRAADELGLHTVDPVDRGAESSTP